jgi:hypothetical protein
VRLVVVDRSTRMPTVDRAAVSRLEETMRATGADVLVLDPMVRLTDANENDAGAADMLAAELTGIAIRRNAAVLALHHNRKGARADVDGADAARGSTATTAAARVALGITKLRPEEALNIGVPPDEAWRFFSLDTTKANLAPLGQRRWFMLASVDLPNADPADGYPEGDSVQVVVPFRPQPPCSLITDHMRHAGLRVIDAGAADPAVGGGAPVPFSPSPRAGGRYAVPPIAGVLEPLMPGASATQREHMAEAVLDELIRKEWVEKRAVRVPKAGGGGVNKRQGLVVRWAATPWLPPDKAGTGEAGTGAAGTDEAGGDRGTPADASGRATAGATAAGATRAGDAESPE